MNLQEIFAQNFARDDLAGAQRWYRHWYYDLDQVLPGDEDCLYSGRAMAGHLSDYLEGYTGEEPESYNGGFIHSYLQTKYGPTIYLNDLWRPYVVKRKVVNWKGRTFVIKQQGAYGESSNK